MEWFGDFESVSICVNLWLKLIRLGSADFDGGGLGEGGGDYPTKAIADGSDWLSVEENLRGVGSGGEFELSRDAGGKGEV